MALHKKSLTEIRGIAQSFGIGDIFTKDKAHLLQEIELKQVAMLPEVTPLPPMPQYDARLMTKKPRMQSSREEIEEILEDHVKMGMTLTFPTEETWHMRFNKKTDTGTIRQPIRTIRRCADKVMS